MDTPLHGWTQPRAFVHGQAFCHWTNLNSSRVRSRI